jgi:G3E family GTPase
MIIDIVFGFLGSGKTTFIRGLLRELGPREKVVIIVNEFGEVGIDGSLLKNQGAEVVEMPSGCICCTLQPDFRSQILDISQTFAPDRVIVEPTGIATIAQILNIFGSLYFEKLIEEVRTILIADVTNFMNFYKASRHFVESQVKRARVVLLNKVDRVKPLTTDLIRDAIASINPQVKIIPTTFANVDLKVLEEALGSVPTQFYEPLEAKTVSLIEDLSPFHDYEAFSLALDLTFNKESLRLFFEELKEQTMGEVERAKGIFRVLEGWAVFQLASGEVSVELGNSFERSGVTIIGKGLKKDLITQRIQECVQTLS